MSMYVDKHATIVYLLYALCDRFEHVYDMSCTLYVPYFFQRDDSLHRPRLHLVSETNSGLISDFPDHATFRVKVANLAWLDKLGVSFSLILCN